MAESTFTNATQILEDGSQPIRGNPIDLDIDILVRPSEQLVPDPAPDDERTAIGGAHAFGDGNGGLQAHRTTLNP